MVDSRESIGLGVRGVGVAFYLCQIVVSFYTTLVIHSVLPPLRVEAMLFVNRSPLCSSFETALLCSKSV
jgi:hypothetical protein